MALAKVKKITTFPSGTTASDLKFDELIEQMIGDSVYAGEGTLDATDLATLVASQTTIAENLASAFDVLGELAEKPGKIESKLESLKTRNYKVAGKRTNTLELSLVGLSNKQKDFLESPAFSTTTLTLVLQNTQKDRLIILNGMKWSMDWSGESDGLFAVTISTEFSGATKDRIYLYKDIPATSGSGGGG